MRDIDFSFGNWIALHGSPEEIDRWNQLVEDVQRLQSEINRLEERLNSADFLIGCVADDGSDPGKDAVRWLRGENIL